MSHETAYMVHRVRYPSYSLAGFLAGVPVVEVSLSEKRGRAMTQHQIASKIGIIDTWMMEGTDVPQWIAITGDTQGVNTDLFLALRQLCKKAVYLETDGKRSLRSGGAERRVLDAQLRPRLPAAQAAH